MSRVVVHPSVDALGPEWDPIFASGAGLQSRRPWFEATERSALPPGAGAHYAAWLAEGRPAALLPMQHGPGGRMASMTTPYTVLFEPLLASGLDPAAAGLAFARHLRAWPVIRLEALDPEWPGLGGLLAGLRRGGLLARRFDHFGNWHEPVAGVPWEAYLAARPGALRETIRRKGRAAARDPSIRFELVRSPDRLDTALDAYEAVYARSWKVPEPFPSFTAELLRRLAALGELRFALMWQGDQPIAAQYWTVDAGIATVLKLAHDDSAKALSPGTLLTAHVVQALLTEGGVRELDFGRGDDPYKAQWAPRRRQRIGLILANPLRLRGLASLLTQWSGQMRRTLLRRT